MHDIPDQVELASEVQRLNNLGVSVLQKGQVMVNKKPLIMTYMNTNKKGKYALGLLTGPTSVFEEHQVNNELGMEFNQFAFAIKASSTDKVSSYWEKLGFPTPRKSFFALMRVAFLLSMISLNDEMEGA